MMWNILKKLVTSQMFSNAATAIILSHGYALSTDTIQEQIGSFILKVFRQRFNRYF